MKETGRLSLAEQMAAAKEKFRGRVLTDLEIVDLVLNANPGDWETSAQWFGSRIDRDQTPINRFAEIAKSSFPTLSEEEKRQFLTGSARFLLGGLRSKATIKTTTE